MSPRFRHVKGKYSVLKAVIEAYSADGDVEKAYEALICGNWSRTLLMGKPKLQLEAFKEHVRSIIVLGYGPARECCYCVIGVLVPYALSSFIFTNHSLVSLCATSTFTTPMPDSKLFHAHATPAKTAELKSWSQRTGEFTILL